ncbi:MAG: acetate--CoA ligase family protein [Candidatus Thermoplasmatota archaeon]|nr:acetate--CoA ligase family protein [Candidatus Thermoplasmatota archaeon]
MAVKPDIKYMFEPRGIAIIGASQQHGKIGYTIVDNIVSSGYMGGIYPINPKGGEFMGKKVYSSLKEVDGIVDVACIVIPAKHVRGAVEECAAKGVKFLVIITSGFSEVGNVHEEKEMVAYAREKGMRILGPNIFGLFSAAASLNATFGPKDIHKGSVSVISQSGAIGAAMIGKTKTEGIGMASIVSVGNKADIDEADLLEYFRDDKNTSIVLMYIEGIKDGERLVDVLRETTKKKPVVVIKSGRSKRGALAAASHTGSLAGSDSVFDSIIRQCGVLRAESIQDALDWCKFISSNPIPRGENAVIITNGGGVGVLAADACEKYDVRLYDDLQAMKECFSGTMPEFGSAKNPVDLTGQADAGDYDKALVAAFERPEISSIICLGCETGLFNAEEVSSILRRNYKKYGGEKPMVCSFFGGPSVESSVAKLKEEGVPVYTDVYQAVSCLGAMYSHYRNIKKGYENPEKREVDGVAIGKVVEGVRGDHRTFLLSHEAMQVAAAAGLRTPKSMIAKNIQQAVQYAEEIGYPVVMKVVSKDIIHKSDVGGIALDLENSKEVVEAFESITFNCKRHKPDALIQGMEIAEMVKKGVETIIGARRDSAFGPIVMFGLGGIYVEVMKDVVFRSYPLSKNEVMKMLASIRSYPLLLGVRGEEMKDIETVAETVIRVGAILESCPDISDIEINPVVVYDNGQGIRAVDVRILLTKEEEMDKKEARE